MMPSSEYENVIRVDPYNSAARRGLERIASAKSDYYRRLTITPAPNF